MHQKNRFQKMMMALRKRYITRGCSRLLKLAVRFNPHLIKYKAMMCDGSQLYVDLKENMCHGYFFFGCLPHEKNEVILIKDLLKNGDTFIDIGANIGYYTRIASSIVGNSGKVISFEPLPSAYKLLCLNSEDLHNVTHHDIALGNENRPITLYVSKCGDASSVINRINGKPIVVEMKRLDTALSDINNVGMIKIDVEGYEYQVLLGARKIISRFAPIVIFEYLKEYAYLSRIGLISYLHFFSEIAEHNYIFYGINEALSGNFLIPINNSRDDVSNYVAVPLESSDSIKKYLCA